MMWTGAIILAYLESSNQQDQQGIVVQKCQASGWDAHPPVLLVLLQQFTSVASFDGNNATSP